MGEISGKIRLAIAGAGPAGYAAAFMAADLGMEVTLINPDPLPGGVCLYQGCIPGKTLLHAAKIINDSRQAAEWGIRFSEPEIQIDRLRAWKNQIVKRLTEGLGQLCKQRKIRYIQGIASFMDSTTLDIQKEESGSERLSFDRILLATGSRPVSLPGLPESNPRIWDSKTALDLTTIPKSLLLIGGGYIGVELGSVYAALGSKVTLVEITPGLLPGVDRNLVSVLTKHIEKSFHAVLLNTKISSSEETKDGIRAKFEGGRLDGKQQEFEAVFVAVGRRPNSDIGGLESTGVEIDERSFIKVNPQRRTSDPSIYAAGDVAGEPMLAHKAMHEGRTAVEAIYGKRVAFEPRAVPSAVYTEPAVAWCGLTEAQADKENLPVQVLRFPWAASGRAATLGRSDGLTKLIVDPESGRVLGAGMVGTGAWELIAEGVLAVEMGALSTDIALSIHPHPTLSETMMEAAQTAAASAIHVFRPKKEKK